MAKKQPLISVLIISRTYPPQIGGVASHVNYLAQALNKHTSERDPKHHVCRVHLLTSGKKERRTKEEGIPPNLSVYRVSGEKGYFGFRGEVLLEEALEFGLNHWIKMRPNVIHAHDFSSIYVGMMLKAVFDVPLIATIHRTPKEWDETLPQRDTKNCFVKAVVKYNLCDWLVAPSEAYEIHLIQHGFTKERIEQINHGIPITSLRSLPNDPTILQELGLTDNYQVIFCPSRLDPHKGIETLIDTAGKLHKQFPHLAYVIAGSGPASYRRELELRIDQKGVRAVFRMGSHTHRDFTPNEMAALFRRARICVIPSLREGFSQSVLESFAFRKPVIGSNTGGIPEIINPDVNGLLFNRAEPADLAKQITRLMRNRTLARKLGNEGYTTLEEKFSDGRMARDYFRFYQKVVRAYGNEKRLQ